MNHLVAAALGDHALKKQEALVAFELTEAIHPREGKHQLADDHVSVRPSECLGATGVCDGTIVVRHIRDSIHRLARRTRSDGNGAHET